MSETNNEVSSKENNLAKTNSKKRKIEQNNIEDFAEKIHKKHLKVNKGEIKKTFTYVWGTYFNCQWRRRRLS